MVASTLFPIVLGFVGLDFVKFLKFFQVIYLTCYSSVENAENMFKKGSLREAVRWNKKNISGRKLRKCQSFQN